MSLISRQIANLFNGVSQQTPALRLPSQAEAQDNCMSSPVAGLYKRAPTEHVAKLLDGVPVFPLVHSINRDKLEKYQVVITDGELQVFDLQGQPKVVTFPNGKDYLRSSKPRAEIKALTVEDYTFVVNKNTRPAMSVTPYLTTDRVVCTLNFGSGELGESHIAPIRPDALFYWMAQMGFTSTGNPEGWMTGSASTFTGALAGFQAQLTSLSGTHGPFIGDATIKEDLHSGNPQYLNVDPPGSNFGLLQGLPADWDAPLSIAIPAVNGGLPFNSNLKIVYKRTGTGDFATIKPDCGWPTMPFQIPGGTYQDRIMPVFDGTLNVQVNGRLFTKGHENGWTATMYLNYFVSAIQSAFPTLTVTTNAGWQMVIEAPAGEQVYVSAWDSNHRGYVTAVYSDLPIQEAVFIVIKSGVAEQTYSISINGHLYEYTTGLTTAPATYKADTISNALAAAINAYTAGGLQAAAFGSFVKVIDPTKAPMTFTAHDTWNDQAMYAMKNRVQAFEDLPGRFIPGHPIEVVGTAGSSGFYVHYTIKGGKPPKAYGLERQVTIERPLTLIEPAGITWAAIEGAETGVWEECAKPGVPDILIPHTMPHVLISNGDGTFTFKPIDWFQRKCGDGDSVPAPSFVGKTFQDIFFHRNRLGFMTAETVLFSRAGQFFNYWAQTAKDVLDSDPIDVQVNHTKVSTLRHTAVFNNQLLLFSDNTQFVITAAQLLSPKTIAVQPSTEFECSPVCKPVTVGRTVNFVSEASSWSAVWEYFVEANSVSNTALNTTAHIPKYVPKDVFKLAASSTLDMVVALSDADPGAMYLYKFLWGAEGKLQQSWSRWYFTGTVLNVDFMENLMVLTVQYPDGVYLETIQMSEGRTDGDLGFLLHVDRKVKLTGTPVGDNYVYNLPYPLPDILTSISPTLGVEVPHTVIDTTTVSVPKGSLVDAQCYFGTVYPMQYVFSGLYMKDKDNIPVLGSSLMLRSWSISYENSIEFTVNVTPEKRATHGHLFAPKAIGINALLGAIVPVNGVFRVPVLGEGKTTRIAIQSTSHYPCFFQSVHWDANYTARARR